MAPLHLPRLLSRGLARRPDPASLVTALLGLSLIHGWASGRLNLLLAPPFHGLVLGAGLVLLLSALAGLALRPSRRLAAARPRSRAALFLAAVALLTMLIPPRPSYSVLVANRASGELEGLVAGFGLPPEQRSLVDWARLWRSAPDPEAFLGEPVRISGFVLRRPDGTRTLARLVVRCCLADATPVDVSVRWPAGRPAPEVDQWLEVRGRVGGGGGTLLVIPDEIRPIARPDQPFDS